MEGLIGKEARVTEKIDNRQGTGEAVVNGQFWAARSADDEIIEPETMTVIEEVRGVRLIVRKL